MHAWERACVRARVLLQSRLLGMCRTVLRHLLGIRRVLRSFFSGTVARASQLRTIASGDHRSNVVGCALVGGGHH
eukprot:15381855-Alexandrium_andersonii.AAC.1